MKVLKCDRCGKVYHENDYKWHLPLVFRVSWKHNEIDLCDNCLEKLQNWMGEYRKEDEK